MKKVLLLQLFFLLLYLMFAAYSQGVFLNNNPDMLGIFVIQIVYPFVVFPICYFLCKKQELLGGVKDNVSGLNLAFITSLFYILGLYMALTLTARVSYMLYAACVFDIVISAIIIFLLFALILKKSQFRISCSCLAAVAFKCKPLKKIRWIAIWYVILSFLTLMISTNVLGFIQEVVVHFMDILAIVLIIIYFLILNARATRVTTDRSQ